jgi:hypothetical protein
MHAIVRPHRIDISGRNDLARTSWTAMLDELKAEHVPSQTPIGERMLVIHGAIFIFRINDLFDMPDAEVVRILERYGIEANIDAELAQGAAT